MHIRLRKIKELSNSILKICEEICGIEDKDKLILDYFVELVSRMTKFGIPNRIRIKDKYVRKNGAVDIGKEIFAYLVINGEIVARFDKPDETANNSPTYKLIPYAGNRPNTELYKTRLVDGALMVELPPSNVAVANIMFQTVGDADKAHISTINSVAKWQSAVIIENKNIDIVHHPRNNTENFSHTIAFVIGDTDKFTIMNANYCAHKIHIDEDKFIIVSQQLITNFAHLSEGCLYRLQRDIPKHIEMSHKMYDDIENEIKSMI